MRERGKGKQKLVIQDIVFFGVLKRREKEGEKGKGEGGGEEGGERKRKEGREGGGRGQLKQPQV